MRRRWALCAGVIAVLAAGTAVASRQGTATAAPGRLVRVTGAEVHIVETGDQGAPVVIEAGAGGSHLEWEEVARRLAPHRVIRVDRPGLGFSPYAEVDRSAQGSARLLGAARRGDRGRG